MEGSLERRDSDTRFGKLAENVEDAAKKYASRSVERKLSCIRKKKEKEKI